MKRPMERILRRIASAARENAAAPLFSLETFLYFASILYGGAVRLRSRLYEKGVLPSRTLPCRVVSIGNLVAGGTGKTPMTIFVARLLRDTGYRVVVISRGYRGQMEDTGGVVSDGRKILAGPAQAGDEPYLMAHLLADIPVMVGRRRYAVGMEAARRFHPDVIVLDDAFQHLSLKRDVNLALLDHRAPLGNGHLIPRGLLREPVSALGRAHAVIFTRSTDARLPSPLTGLPASQPAFFTTHMPVIRKPDPATGTVSTDVEGISRLAGKRVVAFAGLADNRQFFGALQSIGANLIKSFSFRDHHTYATDNLRRISAAARNHAADTLVTTYKDFVKFEQTDCKWPVELVVLDVSVKMLGDEPRFLDLLNGTLRA